MTMEVHCWAATNVGHVRTNNEDAYLTSGQAHDHLVESWEGELGAEGWALVADGMGGHAAGEVASMLAVQCIASVLPSLSTTDEVVAATEAANMALFDAVERRPELSGMGTTIAGVRVLGRSALVFNAGDSRIYHHLGGALQQVSEDHVVGGYMLTKCLGGVSIREPVEPFARVLDLLPGSRLLLCTDGITDELSDTEIPRMLHIKSPADALVQAALAAGGRDNATAVVLGFTD
jgi:protein phosphatase